MLKERVNCRGIVFESLGRRHRDVARVKRNDMKQQGRRREMKWKRLREKVNILQVE